jgi:hypothetical protein
VGIPDERQAILETLDGYRLTLPFSAHVYLIGVSALL